MATEYCRSMLRICIAQLCQNLGWNATQSSPLELLTDILERYLIDLGKISHRYSEQFGRTEPNLDDLALTFRHYGIQLGELEDYIRHVEPVAFAREVVSFPARKRNNLGFPNSRSRELLQHREEHVHNHLPYMYPGMEDEVEEESSQASLPTPQLPQESVSPMAISPTPSDKRPLSNSAEGPPSKRPRLISSNLPEEAGHSQYEMKGLLMNPSGVLTPTRQGKLPDARTPPTFRQSLQFKEEGGQKGRENKEDTPSRPPFSEKPGRQDEEDNRDKSNNCLEKVAPKKKMLKHYKQMTAADTASGMPRSPKVTKLVRSPKPGSPLGTKSPKQKQKAKTKEKIDKREEAGSGGNLPAESCLKDLLLSPKVNVDKVEKTRVSSPLAATPKIKPDSKEKHKDKKEKRSRGDGQDKVSKPLPENQTKHPGSGDLPSRTADADVSSRLPFTVEEDSSNSRDYSPERLVIAEGDTKVKNTKEARQARLALIDDSIDSVIRNSVAEVDKKTDTFTFTEDSEMKMSPKPVKGKKKDKNKVGKESENRPKKKDKKEKSDSQSIADSIDAVIRQSSEENELVPPAPAPAPPVSALSEVVGKEVPELPPPVKTTSPLVMPELGTKKFGKDKSDKKQKKKTSGKKKEKESTTKDKLKDKLKVKSEKQDLSEMDKKPSVLDKFSAQEYSVYDFPESPPSLPPRPKKATPKSGTSPKQSLAPSNPPPVPTPLPTPPPPPPVTTPAPPPPPPPPPPLPTKEESPLTPVSDQPPLMTLKILDLKHKQKDKERSKDKEHKKEKKEKKKDKEKKKKNKDKDKEKSRDKSKSREDKHKDLPGSSPVGGLVVPIKLNIKFGGPGGTSAATSTVITEPKITSPKPEPLPVSPKTPRPEPLLSPKREIPKLVIKPIRRESLEAKAKLGAASRSPAVMSPPKSPPPPPVAPSPATTPALPPVTAPPAQVPAPPPAPPSPPPPPKIKTPPKSPTPPPSSPKPKTPPPSPPPPPPTPSPPPPPKSPIPPPRLPTPPPHSPTPEKLPTPSPEPKLHTPQSSPMRKSPTPEPTSPPHKSPTPVKRSPPIKNPSPRNVPSPKSSPPSSPLSPRLEMDIDHEEEPEPKPKPKPKPSKQSPKGKTDKGDKSDRSDKGDKSERSDKGDKSEKSDKGDKSEKSDKGDKNDTKPSPKGKRGRKPKEKEDKEEPKAAVRSRNKSIPTVTSETVSETPITGPIVQRTVVAETIGTFLDAEGNKVWICPACKMQDDGSPMIGCDVCDDWYHWVCMDIKQEPEEDEWFCPRCEETRSKSKTPKGKPKGKKRGRKKKT